MGLLQKIFKRGGDHDDWLASHPGKESKDIPPPSVSDEDAQKMRERMEAEMVSDGDRTRSRNAASTGADQAKDA